jgi:hypothetical protein
MEYYENDYPDNYTSTETRSSQLWALKVNT